MSDRSAIRFLQGFFDQLSLQKTAGRRKRCAARANSLRFERLEDRQMLSGLGLLSNLLNLLPTVQNIAGKAAQVANPLVSQISITKTTPVARPAADAFEADDTASQAKPIASTGTSQTHTLDNKTDVDWVTFTIAQPSDVVIETRGTIGDTRMWLYSGQTVGGQLQLNQVQFDDNGGVGQFSRIICAGSGTTSALTGHHSLAADTYYVKIDASPSAFVPINYTLSVTTLQPGDVFLEKSTSKPSDILISSAIRIGEASQLGIPLSSTYFHSALYLGQDLVAEMLATGFTDRTSLEQLYDHDAWIDVYRRKDIGTDGQAVVDAIEKYQGTPYAFSQIGVFGLATLMPSNSRAIKSSLIYATYMAEAYGPRRMICSELVAMAFADAKSGDSRSLALSVTMWPSISRLGNTSSSFRMDFTSPTMLSLSPSLQRLNV
jgi:hypothetical protein